MAKKREEYRGYDPPPAAERLVDRVWADFHDLRMGISAGLASVLEAEGASPKIAAAVALFVVGVVKELDALEGNVVRLARMPGTENAGYGVVDPPDPISGFDPKEAGHLSLKSLFEEWTQDYAAAKRESYPLSLGDVFDKKMQKECKEPEKGADRGFEM